jgi:transposase
VTSAGLIHRCFWQETTGDQMAWTAATRGDYVRPSGTYASDVTDREWALIAPLLPPARRGGRPRSTCLRRVVNAVFYLLQAGCQWRMLPRDFPPRSTGLPPSGGPGSLLMHRRFGCHGRRRGSCDAASCRRSIERRSPCARLGAPAGRNRGSHCPRRSIRWGGFPQHRRGVL